MQWAVLLFSILAWMPFVRAQDVAGESAGFDRTAADVMVLEQRAFAALSGVIGRLRPSAAVPELTEAAVAGSSAAMEQLASMLWYGEGVPQSKDEAVRMLRRAAELGNYKAQVFLGGLHLFGEQVEQDFLQARVWFEAAANQGDAFAMFELAELYGNGLGVEADDSKRYELLTRAAELSNPDAQRELGILHFHDAVRRDYAKAFYLLELVAEEDKDAARELGYQYLLGQHGEQNFVLAAKWISKAVDLGDATATLLLADITEDGLGVERDLEFAEQLRAEIIATSSAEELNDIAWRYAVAPQELFRNGPLAVEVMEDLLASSDMVSATRLDTLAAAYAEAGRFDDAIATQEAAIAQLSAEREPGSSPPDLDPRLADFRSRLDSYRSGLAYRLPE